MNNTFITAFNAPLYVAWELTHKCNAKCLHCYSNSSPDANCESELSTQEALNLIDELADAGLLVLAFSGGEPMLRKDWSTLVAHAVNLGMSVNIGTNGSCITTKTAQQLKQLGVKSVTVSLDSHKSEIHDHFRQFPGLYNKTIKAIKILSDLDIRVVIGFTPTKINWLDGREIIELSIKLGAKAVNLSEYVPAGRGTTKLALSPEELRNTLEQWIQLREVYKENITLIWHDCRVGMLVPDNEKRDYIGCGAGRLLARILPDGTITPCVFLPTPIGKYPQLSFNNIWQHTNLLTQFRERKNITGNCGECEHLQTCGGCRAVSYAYSNGDPFAGDPHCWIKSKDNIPLTNLFHGEGLPV